MPFTVPRVTVSATASVSASNVEYLDSTGALLEDADSAAAGFQIDLAGEGTAVFVLITPTDRPALAHTIIVEKDSGRFGGRTPSKDIYYLDQKDNTQPIDIWSDGTTMWVSNSTQSNLYRLQH